MTLPPPTTDDLIDTYVIWHLESYRNRTVDVAQQAERDLRAQAEKTLAAHDREVRAQALREAASAPIPRAALNTRNNGLRQWLRARADRIERGE